MMVPHHTPNKSINTAGLPRGEPTVSQPVMSDVERLLFKPASFRFGSKADLHTPPQLS
jgi:hypothetical protein